MRIPFSALYFHAACHDDIGKILSRQGWSVNDK
ncbi:hypothetical protein P775_20360 [Puniceibacterium antarcticum]|uniref:Uncharacterized protein n=1 Tax=Puniceibacterium antarcticum TaxID=1206336 RepID=A0A2G8R9R1_9RHOB|nr:hypothetical protein P775_20360 [Puniceibacterium antarcticum]